MDLRHERVKMQKNDFFSYNVTSHYMHPNYGAEKLCQRKKFRSPKN